MMAVTEPSCAIYEGQEPYLFISYSHRDFEALEEIKVLFHKHRIRYWYDDGLHSGDDWNMVIAKRLQSATVCLLLLSPNSAESEYVKNELSFAMAHRIPIHTLLLEEFTLPLDIDMMTGRIQRVLMQGDYGEELLRAIPAEVTIPQSGNPLAQPAEETHPLFVKEDLLSERQGTKLWQGKHRTLHYPCLISEDSIKPSDKTIAQTLSVMAAGLTHPVFPDILDAVILQDRMQTYQRYRKEAFLDGYLETHTLSEDTVLDWILCITDAMELLFRQNLGLRDFSRGSVTVVNDTAIGLSRLQNPYYGLIRFQAETKTYYFERELQEIAILLAQLCTGKIPSLPLRMIEDKRFSKAFLEKVNLVIQKCTKENGRAQYTDFSQLRQDLTAAKLSREDKKFLQRRRVLLENYEKEKKRRQLSDEMRFGHSAHPVDARPTSSNAEQEFGFDETVFLGGSQAEDPFGVEKATPQIRLQVCSTGEVMDFFKSTVKIGKDHTCDMVWTQPYISRLHAVLRKLPDGMYAIADMHSSNGTYIVTSPDNKQRVSPDREQTVAAGTVIEIGTAQIKIL